MGALSGVRATARIRAAAAAPGHGTVLPLLAGEGPLALRRTRALGAGAEVTVVGAMSAPLGGDRLRIEAEVCADASLTVGSAAATVSLPGGGQAPAVYGVRLTVGPGAELRWLPEPVIAARGSDLRMTTVVDLAPTACLVLREEQILGRFGEIPGRVVSRLTVRVAGRPLLDQEVSFGPGAAPGWDGPAGLAGHRAVGQLLYVGPSQPERPADSAGSAGPGPAADAAAVLDAGGHGRATRTPLALPGTGAPGRAVLVTAVAADGRHLRSLLEQAVAL